MATALSWDSNASKTLFKTIVFKEILACVRKQLYFVCYKRTVSKHFNQEKQ